MDAVRQPQRPSSAPEVASRSMLAESPPPSESISNGHSNDLPVTASRVRRTDQTRQAPNEKLKFAVILAEKIADLFDAHQSHAKQTNPQELLGSQEFIERFKLLFVAAVSFSQDLPIALTQQEAFAFLHGVKFHQNYLRHLKSRTYLGVFGSIVATATSPSTPGMGGLIYFVKDNELLRKKDGYGDEVVEEILRRGTENAILPERSASAKVSRLTTDAVVWIEARHEQEQKRAIEQVIRGFQLLDESPPPQWIEQARREFSEMRAGVQPSQEAVASFAMPGVTQMQSVYTDQSGLTYSSYPTNKLIGQGLQQAAPGFPYGSYRGYRPASPWPQQTAPRFSNGPHSAYQPAGPGLRQSALGFMSSQPSNSPFATQLGEVGDVRSGNYVVNENEREQSRYYGFGTNNHPYSDQQYLRGSGPFATGYVGDGFQRGVHPPQQHRRGQGSRPGAGAGLSANNQEGSREDDPPKKASKTKAKKPKKPKKKNGKAGAATNQDPALEENAALVKEWPEPSGE